MSPKKSKSSRTIPSPAADLRPDDVPANRGMLFAVRDELSHRMAEMEGRLTGRFDAKFEALDQKFQAMDAKFEARFQAMDAKFEARFQAMDANFEARFQAMDVKVDGIHHSLAAEISRVHTDMGRLGSELRAEISRVGVLVEEQNARNAVVLEGLSGLFRRQEKVEDDVEDMKSFIQRMTISLRKSGLQISS